MSYDNSQKLDSRFSLKLRLITDRNPMVKLATMTTMTAMMMMLMMMMMMMMVVVEVTQTTATTDYCSLPHTKAHYHRLPWNERMLPYVIAHYHSLSQTTA